ncbi:MAG: exodeoxyribonuclease III [Planctomycetota bacterium]
MLKIATFNVNSIRARMPILLDWLKASRPDVLCVQETKVVDADFPFIEIKGAGYHAAFRGEKSYNGVAILSRGELKNVSFGLDDGGEPDEARLIRATYNGVHIINTYVPQGRDAKLPAYQYKLEWFARLAKFIARHYTTRQKVLWCGDLNVAPADIDVHDPKRLLGHVCFNPEVQAAFQGVVDWGFVDVFRKHHPEPGCYTFYDYRAPSALKAGKGWRIDHMLATKPLAAKSADCTIDLGPRKRPKPSDHTPLVATFDA